MNALYGGYQVTHYDRHNFYKIEVKEGVRGFNIPVFVRFDSEDKPIVSYKGMQLTVVNFEKTKI